MDTVLPLGQAAPDLELEGIAWNGEDFATGHYLLSEQRGHPVVLAFYPIDNSRGCTSQLCGYNEELATLSELDARVWAISPQDLDSHREFARSNRLGFPLLSDPERVAVEAYGIALPLLGLRRSVFIVDAEGVLRWASVSRFGTRWPSAAEIRRQLEGLGQG